jgi:hypothetical protein
MKNALQLDLFSGGDSLIEERPAIQQEGGGSIPTSPLQPLYCRRCGTQVSLETVVMDYPYYCPECDENMFSFEVEQRCHQYNLRLKSSREETHTIVTTLEGSTVVPISAKEATPMILKYEYLGKVAGWSKYCFGHYFNEELGGVLMFGTTTGASLSFSRLLPNLKVLQLQRGVNAWWTPKNSASFFITRACRWLKDNTDIDAVTATADIEAGEIGTIYQSLNWVYLGQPKNGHPVFVLDGKEVHPKTMYDRYGTCSVPRLKVMFGTRLVCNPRVFKHRYIHPIRKVPVTLQSKPYPKRGDNG